ncbi:MAG: amidophosphoribosyltransferase [Methanosarcinales archaeon]
MQDKCGIVGVAFLDPKDPNNAALSIYYALYALQHRGQESAGITIKGHDVRTYKGMGLVPEVFSKEILQKLTGNIGIGHVRYSTTGESKIENAQPLTVNFKGKTLAIAHNGNLVNSEELRRKLENQGCIFLSDSDTEVIVHLLVKELLKNDIVNAVKETMKKLVGSYSLVILIEDILIAVRDPLGFKPLCLGKTKDGYVVASESVAIDTLEGELIRDVYPGEILVFHKGDIKSYQIWKTKNTAHCVFEYIYFARADSIIDNKLVYDVRIKIGENLFLENSDKADIVSPVPDSGITSAIGYSKKSGIPYLEGLMKNRYIGRTFIMPSDDMRKSALRLKMNVIKSNVYGKEIILIDDSIVRGTTSYKIIDLLKKAGAKKIHMRIGSPPIISPCYMGIDMATRKELIAAHKTIEGVEALIKADSLRYLSISGLVKSVGISEKNLCMACLTGVYPVEIQGEFCKKREIIENMILVH